MEMEEMEWQVSEANDGMTLELFFSQWFFMDTEVGMVMSWCWVRGGDVYGPLF